jgi:acyl-CoA thioesterase
MSHAAEEQQLAEHIVSSMMAKDAFSQWLGLEVVDVRPRNATVRMTVRNEMVNGFGVCHGGIAFSLADSALAFASNTHGRLTVAVENTISYPKAISPGDVLTASAEEESATNRLGFYRVTVRRADEEIVALFRGTVYKTHRAFFSDSE